MWRTGLWRIFCFERKEEMGMENINEVPEIQAFADYIRNPLFERLCTDMEEHYHIKPRVEFSRCSWEYGWNIKFKKSGKSLCTLYPRENYFTVLVVVGEKERERVEAILPGLSLEIQKIYRETKEGNGQRWLMIDLEDEEKIYADIRALIDIRAMSR